MLSAVLACALSFGTAGCSGGGSSIAPPASAAAPPEPAPRIQTISATSGPRPSLTIERASGGSAYLRVTEPSSYDPFAGNPLEDVIRDRKVGPAPGTSFVIAGPETTLVENLSTSQMKYGIQIMDAHRVLVRGFRYDGFDGGGQIHGGAIKIGNNDRPTQRTTFIQNAVADGKQQPDGSYDVSNTDFVGAESNNAPVYLRNVTGRNFGDAGIDSKTSKVYVMNATIENAHRLIRAWGGVEIILVNSIVNAAPGHAQVWVHNGASAVKYHNVVWCEGADAPALGHPKCRDTPWLIEGGDISPEAARGRVTRLTSNPLPEASPFFASAIDRVVVEYSRDGGSWQSLRLANTGGAGSAPVGDLRWKIPLDLSSGAYRFRASFEKDGRRIGQTSAIIDEAGAKIG